MKSEGDFAEQVVALVTKMGEHRERLVVYYNSNLEVVVIGAPYCLRGKHVFVLKRVIQNAIPSRHSLIYPM